MRKTLSVVALGAAAVLALAGCTTSTPAPDDTSGAGGGELTKVTVGVIPIVDGVAGPVGLGGNHYKLSIVVPGYHTLTRVFWGNGDFSTTTALTYCLHPA